LLGSPNTIASAVTEEYLETIYNMTMEGDPVIGARLAEKFGVARATVTQTIKRLTAAGYASMDDTKHISLTAPGRELTEQVLRRHRLAERLLFDVLGMDAVSAHEQAHTIEHAMSEDMAQRISERLGHPLTCPHGNPIPGNATSGMAFLKEQNAVRLSEARAGQSVRVVLISEVVEDESETLRRLSEKKVHPNAVLRVIEADPQSAVVFESGDKVRSLPWELSTKIWVTIDPASGAIDQE
jgi:DtxR family Mn-dependent transcriptional regulator